MHKPYSLLMTGIVGVTLLLSACRARFYTANRNPVPLFQSAGEVYLDASSNFTSKVDLTAGLAVTNQVAAYVGYGGAFLDRGDLNSLRDVSYRGNMFNAGLGFFMNQRLSDRFRFEIYGDYASGDFKNRSTTSDNQFFNGNYTRLGVLMNMGHTSYDQRFAFSYSARLSEIRFRNGHVSDSSFWSYDIARYRARSSYQMLEHAINFRYGSPELKFQVQLAAYHGLNASELGDAIPYLNAAIMFGVVVNTKAFGF